MKLPQARANAAVVLLVVCCSSPCFSLGSQSQLWEQRSEAEKVGFLRGLCEGIKHYASNPVVEQLYCTDPRGGVRPKERFCMALYRGKGKDAIQFFDQFYKAADHSDVPNVYAILAFNDHACGENKSASGIRSSQAFGKCNRQWYELMEDQQERSVLEAKKAECDKLRNK